MVARSLFSAKLTDDEALLMSNAITEIQEFIFRWTVHPYLTPWFALSGQLRKYKRMRREAESILRNHIRNRRRERSMDFDLLQSLLDARYGAGSKGMSDEQVLSDIVQILVAGHMPSSSALSWALYLLSRHPDYLQSAREEFDTVVGDGPLQFSHVQDLRLNIQILDEGLRVYPPFWMIDRVALADDRVGRVCIPKGTTVLAYIYGAHHDSSYWDNPDAFVPERFNKEAKKGHRGFSYVPFGGGPRGCLGASYAVLQMLMILNRITRNYDFELCPGHSVELNPEISLKARHGIVMRFTRRQ